MKKLLLALVLSIFSSSAFAAVGTVYVNTAGTAGNSGTSDTVGPIISGTAATWTSCVGDPCTITLDTNTNFATVTGCSAGTCDSSQAIFLTNATASNAKIFWIASYTGCTGSGACTVTLSVKGTGAGNNPNWATCATCTAQAWAIGGQYIWPSAGTAEASVSGALRPGDTLQFDNSPAAKSTGLFNARNPGDTTTGKINIIGKAGQLPVLTTSSGIVLNLSTQTNYYISNLSLNTTTASGTNAIAVSGGGTVINAVTITGTGSSACISLTVADVTIMNSKITGCVTSGITTTGANDTIFGNYIFSTTGDCITETGNNGLQVINNVLYNCGGRGIYWSGTPTVASNPFVITNNTVYMASSSAALEVATAAAGMQIFNNIFYNSVGNSVTWDAGNAQLVAVHNYNVFFGTLSGLTTNATEITSDPQIVSPSTGNFNLTGGSPAIGIGFPGTITGLGTAGSSSPGAMNSPGTITGGGGGHIIGG